MVFAMGEKTPLRPIDKKRATLVTNTWIYAIVASCSALVLLGFFAHWHHMSKSQHLRTTSSGLVIPTGRLHKSATLHTTAHRRPAKDATAIFQQCNPSVQGLPSVFVKQECRSEQAEAINAMLRKEGYSFDAIVPQPYTYPAHILETLLAMNHHQRKLTIKHLNVIAGKLGKLGTLVKLFAWGVPVTMQEVTTAIGGDIAVLTALQDCGIVAKCEVYPDILRSSIQLFPIQRTSIIVATDWYLHRNASQEAIADKAIQAVDAHDIFLILNIPHFPQPQNTKILNLASGSGAIGLAAAERGASVVLSDTNPRAAIFGHFNIWLNSLSYRVRVALRDSDIKERDFFLILAHPPSEKAETTISASLQAARHSNGMTIVSFEGQSCEGFTEKYNSEFCGEAGKNHADLVGSIVCRHPHGYNSDVISMEGMAFVWKGDVEDPNTKSLEEMDKCGHFETLHSKSFIGNVGVPACTYGKPGMMCPDAGDFEVRS